MTPHQAEMSVLEDVKTTLTMHLNHSRDPYIVDAARVALRRLVTNQPLATPAITTTDSKPAQA